MNAVTPFARAAQTLRPGATGRDLVQLLDGRAKRSVALHWYAGRRQAPQWSLQLLAAKIRQQIAEPAKLATELETAPERLGIRAGANNIQRWRARRHESKRPGD